MNSAWIAIVVVIVVVVNGGGDRDAFVENEPSVLNGESEQENTESDDGGKYDSISTHGVFCCLGSFGEITWLKFLDKNCHVSED